MSSDESSSRSSTVLDRKPKNRVTYYCGWEAKFGYGVAVTLAVFEAKRFLMLVLEVLADWQVIRFAGGSKPLLLSLADIGLGLPTALTTIRAIRPRKHRNCYTGKKRTLACLRVIIILCALMNVATLVSIGCHINIRQSSLIQVFNTSMRLYTTTASYKYAIDKIQFDFECCGYSSYEDWFLFDWQRIDYSSREEMAEKELLSDEEMRDRSVPFSCCNIEAMAPCVHTELSNEDFGSINLKGCVGMLSPVLLRIVIVAYLVTSTLLVTQIILAFLVAKITRKLLSPEARHYNCAHGAPGNAPCMVPFNSTSSAAENHGSNSSSAGSARRGPVRRAFRGFAKKIKRASSRRCIRSRNTRGSRQEFSASSSDSDGPCMRHVRCPVHQAARIHPSVHQQHVLPKTRLVASAAAR